MMKIRIKKIILKLQILIVFVISIPFSVNSQCPGTGFDPCNAVPITVNGACVTMRNNNCNNFTNPGTCNSGAYRDVWGTFTVGVETNITITWTSTNNRDGILHLYRLPSGGNCALIGDFVEITCADNVGSITGIMETINTTLITGETYYIRGQRKNSNGGIGGGTMCVTGVVVGGGNPGDDCANTIRVNCGDPILVGESTVGNGDTENNWSCGTVGPYPGEDRFYVVQWPDASSGGTIRVNFTNVSDGDTYMEMFYLGTSCSPNSCIDESQFDISTQTITGSALTYWEINVPAGIQDHYFVIDSQGDGVDSYDMEVTCFATGISLDQTNSCGGGSSPCNYSLEMYDSWGDGWNGGYIDLYVNGPNTGPHSAAGSGTITPIAISTGDVIQLDYTSGSWENENSFVFRDGRNLALRGEGPPPTTGTLYNGTATDINCGFDASNPNQGVYCTWQKLDGAGIPIADELLSPPTYDPSTGGQYRVCESIYVKNLGWEWLKDAVITVGDCWTNISALSPNGTNNGFYNWDGDWTASWNSGTREISYTFANSSNPAWGDGNTNNYTCSLFQFCFDADIDPTCVPVDGFQNSLSVTDDGIGGSGGSTGTANVTAPSTSSTTNILPIELISFSAKAEKNNNKTIVKLNWVTASEINNDYFTIERSVDAKNFEIISTLKGAGNSNTVLSYSSIDENPHNGINYYRLKQTDYDGKFEYFNIIPVNINIINDIHFNIFPNPANYEDNVYVEFKGFDPDKEVLVVVIDILGQELYSKVLFTNFDGNTVSAIDPYKSLPVGTYIIIGSSDDRVYKKKLIIK